MQLVPAADFLVHFPHDGRDKLKAEVLDDILSHLSKNNIKISLPLSHDDRERIRLELSSLCLGKAPAEKSWVAKLMDRSYSERVVHTTKGSDNDRTYFSAKVSDDGRYLIVSFSSDNVVGVATHAFDLNKDIEAWYPLVRGEAECCSVSSASLHGYELAAGVQMDPTRTQESSTSRAHIKIIDIRRDYSRNTIQYLSHVVESEKLRHPSWGRPTSLSASFVAVELSTKLLVWDRATSQCVRQLPVQQAYPFLCAGSNLIYRSSGDSFIVQDLWRRPGAPPVGVIPRPAGDVQLRVVENTILVLTDSPNGRVCSRYHARTGEKLGEAVLPADSSSLVGSLVSRSMLPVCHHHPGSFDWVKTVNLVTGESKRFHVGLPEDALPEDTFSIQLSANEERLIVFRTRDRRWDGDYLRAVVYSFD